MRKKIILFEMIVFFRRKNFFMKEKFYSKPKKLNKIEYFCEESFSINDETKLVEEKVELMT